MKKASVFFLAATALFVASCSSNDENTDENGEEKVETMYSLDAGASSLMWHGEENEAHYHDGSISVTEGTMTMAGDDVVSGEFVIDPNSIKGQTEGYPAEKMDYLSTHLKDTAFLFTQEYPTIKVTTGAYKDGMLETTINVRGVDLKTSIPVAIKKDGDNVSVKGDFTVDFSSVGMPYLQMTNEETGEPSAKSGIQFKMDLTLNKK